MLDLEEIHGYSAARKSMCDLHVSLGVILITPSDILAIHLHFYMLQMY